MDEAINLPAGLSLKARVAEADPPIIIPPFECEVNRSTPSGAGLVVEEPFIKSPSYGSVIPLIARLCETLHEQKVTYCHWKSNWRLDRWMRGEGDLDLLVARADTEAFTSIISQLGFKHAVATRDREVPGILNYYGFDAEAERFVHLHVHYQLVIGHDLTKNYHLPLEKLYLESATRQDLISLPAPEFELIGFVLRMVLKHSASEAIMRRMFHSAADSGNAVQRELEYLEGKADRAKVHAVLLKTLPAIEIPFFELCEQSLRAGCSLATRTLVRLKLQRILRVHARNPQAVNALLKWRRRATRVLRERVFRYFARKRFVNGGMLLAVVGGDGAGKTTSLSALNAWLAGNFVTKTFHLGKPRRSPITLAVILGLRIRRLFITVPVHPERQLSGNGKPAFPGYLQLFRWVCAARDRHRLYGKARRFATDGGIALCDRYPLSQVRLMESPNIARTVVPARRNALVNRMLRAEMGYYREIMPADLLVVLRVDPEIAVRRKPSESRAHVLARSSELWQQDWQGTAAHVIDVAQPIADVVARLRSIVWAGL